MRGEKFKREEFEIKLVNERRKVQAGLLSLEDDIKTLKTRGCGFVSSAPRHLPHRRPWCLGGRIGWVPRKEEN